MWDRSLLLLFIVLTQILAKKMDVKTFTCIIMNSSPDGATEDFPQH